jgi:ferredoxin
MRGILEGMGLTFTHLFRPKVTRLYPYEKPKLPPRSRGLIQLIAQEGLKTDFNLICEGCLLCEKACPPRAITIEYEPMHSWRERPWFESHIREGAEKFTSRKLTAASGASKAGFYIPRISEYAIEYHDKPVSPCVSMPVKDYLEPELDLGKVDELLERWPQEAILQYQLLLPKADPRAAVFLLARPSPPSVFATSRLRAQKSSSC